ncbi:Druantia anti-phage system protein DruA [Haliangium sp. UPWRP_2]|uniref:Druantia anti-phage system protein DruA n=1 Tax=Haliangium sp. UPWRP_2 TaxID=1931276 RepID=UPI001304941E|nr:Druantia anti-phage system protein DruA [Haliangium sp. UPWRP_2]
MAALAWHSVGLATQPLLIRGSPRPPETALPIDTPHRIDYGGAFLPTKGTSGSVRNENVIADSTVSSAKHSQDSVAATPAPARVGLSLVEQGWRPFAPRFEDDSSALARLAKVAALPEEARLSALEKELSRLESINAPQHRYRAAALLLRDLTKMGWLVCVDRGQIYIRPHEAQEAGGQPPKSAIRRQHVFARDDQLSEDATRRFIHTLERPSRFSSCRPVTNLIADGRRLAELLLPIARMPREARAAALRTVCRPYLQLATEQRDEHTNIRLIDIWRYFRHTWISRYRSMPGRNLFYLVRDAAQPYHPVMAITALGNAVMQLTIRDTWLGWKLEGLQALLAEGLFTDQEILTALRDRLRRDLDDLYLADLGMDQFGEHQTETLLAHLRRIEEESRDDRQAKLKARHTRLQAGEDDSDEDIKPLKVSDISKIDLVAAAKRPLFRSKRARAARELVQALDALKRAHGTLAEALADPKAAWAIGQALRQLKKLHSATSMMEIIICGAAPPYNHLLGGKLACLMMLSPRVVADYYERYKDESSIIASQMAGRPIIKAPHLVLLGTTSLYTERSSQYNRLVLPKGTLPGQLSDLRYIERGLTGGYGQPNLSRQTEAALAALSTSKHKYRNVNFEYGEGQSPKLRQLREGFSALGLDASELLNHGSSRIVYLAPLADNARRYLLGIESQPRGAGDPVEGDARVAEFWRSRWLASRLDHEPALAALAASSPLPALSIVLLIGHPLIADQAKQLISDLVQPGVLIFVRAN